MFSEVEDMVLCRTLRYFTWTFVMPEHHAKRKDSTPDLSEATFAAYQSGKGSEAVSVQLEKISALSSSENR